MKFNLKLFTAVLLTNTLFLGPAKADTNPVPETTTSSEAMPGINNISEEDAKAFIKKLQTTLTSKQIREVPDKMADLIHYPLRWIKDTKHPKKSTVTVKDKDDFLRHYDEILTPKIKDAIFRETGDNLLINAQGCMIGNGQVWFDEQGITTLNSF